MYSVSLFSSSLQIRKVSLRKSLSTSEIKPPRSVASRPRPGAARAFQQRTIVTSTVPILSIRDVNCVVLAPFAFPGAFNRAATSLPSFLLARFSSPLLSHLSSPPPSRRAHAPYITKYYYVIDDRRSPGVLKCVPLC